MKLGVVMSEEKNWLDDIKEPAFKIVSERLLNPLVFGFCLSWCAWNYKFLVILFSDADVSKTFSLVAKYAFRSGEDFYLRGIFYPAISSMSYVVLMPVLNLLVNVYQAGWLLVNVRVQNWIDRNEPIAKEKSIAMRMEMRSLIADAEKNKVQVSDALLERDQLVDEIARLNKQLAEHLGRGDDSVDAVSDVKTALEDDKNIGDKKAVGQLVLPNFSGSFTVGVLNKKQLSILRVIMREGGVCLLSKLEAVEPNKMLFEAITSDLIKMGLVEKEFVVSSSALKLTKAGGEFVLSKEFDPYV